ncbi:hypothetical protein CYMTET_52675 [Cymbomonas tetramitiformis]|uniref:cysteine--tRNA ligase n=1 Tax=Cymbomonas tetramitiformis TaxID=36881 RepID=A0AAE0BIT5_9CHLO|nr:hypothetical protein CYMTET_52675 [Cymbomonas tetramitiformis]
MKKEHDKPFDLWYPPEGSVVPGLHVNNSICQGKVPFTPSEGRKVKWYTCGPTVYDKCHMGHARAYLTFDIIRRIMEDYFRYEVLFQVNVTDIDDKIIKRARCNKLVADYEAESKAFEDVCTDVDAAVGALKAKLEKKLSELQEPLPDGTPTRLRDERETLLKEQMLKVEQVRQTEEAVEAAKADKSVPKVIATGRDALSEWLDALKGHTVDDHSVFDAHGRKYEDSFLQDMEQLGVRRPDLLTRVSEYVPEVVIFIQKLIDDKFAYESNGSVYFDTSKFKCAGHAYPKLKAGQKAVSSEAAAAATEDVTASAAEMAEGEGALSSSFTDEKRSAFDFALWKKSKAGEPWWDSPWDKGRPGWHIECSVMATEVLGANMDIHAGGSDLKFPHHDNEMAQSEAFHGCNQWVNYFLHAGHLNIRGLKMSKSLKNFITIQQALEEHTPRQLRLMFLMQSWDKDMIYSDQVMEDARAKEKLFVNFFRNVKTLLREGGSKMQNWRQAEKDLAEKLQACQANVHVALCDNFDTTTAMAALVNMASEVNKYMNSMPETDLRALLIRKTATYITQMLRTFGVIEGHDDIGFPSAESAGGGDAEAMVAPYVDAMVQFRDQIRERARKEGLKELLELCDAVRDDVLVSLGVRVEDRTDAPSTWMKDDPETLKREVEEKRQQAKQAAEKKRRNQLNTKIKELDKWTKARVTPQEMFKAEEGKFSEFDTETGIPTKDNEGKPISKSVAKNLEKMRKKQTDLVEDFLAKGGFWLLNGNKILTD